MPQEEHLRNGRLGAVTCEGHSKGAAKSFATPMGCSEGPRRRRLGEGPSDARRQPGEG